MFWKGRRGEEIARINHSEKLLWPPARVQKTQRDEEKTRNEADSPSEGTNGTPASVEVFAKEGTGAPQEEFIICCHRKYSM